MKQHYSNTWGLKYHKEFSNVVSKGTRITQYSLFFDTCVEVGLKHVQQTLNLFQLFLKIKKHANELALRKLFVLFLELGKPCIGRIIHRKNKKPKLIFHTFGQKPSKSAKRVPRFCYVYIYFLKLFSLN